MQDLAEEESFLTTNLTTLLNRVTSFRMTEPLGKEAKAIYGFDKPQATVTLTVNQNGQEEQLTLEIGSADEDGDYPVKWSGSPYYVQVSKFTGDSLIEESRDKFVEIAEANNEAETSTSE